MLSAPYPSVVVGSLIYVMVCTRSNIACVFVSLIYLMVCTRSNITCVFLVVSNYPWNFGNNNWEALKWFLGILRAHLRCVCVMKKVDPILKSYIHADMAGDLDSKKSTLGYKYIFFQYIHM